MEDSPADYISYVSAREAGNSTPHSQIKWTYTKFAMENESQDAKT